jgi:hypothetical protein
VARLLAKEPADRPDDEGVAAELTALRSAGRPLLVIEPPSRQAEPPPPKRRGGVLAATGAVLVAAVLAAILLWPSGEEAGPPPPALAPTTASASPDPVRIELDPPVDHQDFVELTWRAPPNLDFVVLVTEAGQAAPEVKIAQRATNMQVPVRRDVGYCFRIQATSPRGTWQSEPRSIRQAAIC